jgi:predicted PurR-regulated permease PerM
MVQLTAALLLPLVLSVLLFYTLGPIVDRLAHWRVPRVIASLAVVVGLLGVLGGGATALWPQVDAVLTKVPAGAARLRTTFRRQRAVEGDTTLERVQAAARALDSAAAEASRPPARRPGVLRVEVLEGWRVSDLVWTGGLSAIGLAGQAATVLFLTIVLLSEGDVYRRKLVAQAQTWSDKRLTLEIVDDIARQIQRFVWVQIATSCAVGLVTWLALWFLGVEEPAVWGLFAGVMNVVPYFGPLIVTGGLAVVGFLQFGSLEMTAIVAGIVLAITTIEGMVLTPMLLSRAAELSPASIFVAIAFWSWAWGAAGMLLAVPMLMAFKAVCDHVDGLKAFGRLIGR